MAARGHEARLVDGVPKAVTSQWLDARLASIESRTQKMEGHSTEWPFPRAMGYVQCDGTLLQRHQSEQNERSPHVSVRASRSFCNRVLKDSSERDFHHHMLASSFTTFSSGRRVAAPRLPGSWVLECEPKPLGGTGPAGGWVQYMRKGSPLSALGIVV